MLKTFSGVWDKKLSTEIFAAYNTALDRYPDEEIQAAGYKCLENCKFFPKPSEILEYIGVNEADKRHENRFNRQSGKCQVCGKGGVMAMKDEWDYDLQIPRDGLWKCRQCYTGMTDDEIRKRYKKLMDILKKIKGRTWKTKTSQKIKQEKEEAGISPREVYDRKMELLGQYEKIKTGEVEL